MPNDSQQATEIRPVIPKRLGELATDREGLLRPEDSLETAGERMRTRQAAAWPVMEGQLVIGISRI